MPTKYDYPALTDPGRQICIGMDQAGTIARTALPIPSTVVSGIMGQNQSRGFWNIRRVLAAFNNSLVGLKALLRHEAAFQQEIVLFLVLAPLGLWWGEGAVERVLLVGSLVLVMIVEALNSAVEAAIDRIGSERHELSGRAKDIGSTAVLLALLLTLFTWALILLPRFLEYAFWDNV